MAKFKGVERPCEVCGKLFRSPQSHAHVRSCSNECGDKLRAASRRGEWVKLACSGCGKEFEERACHSSRRVFCSRECLHKDPGLKAKKAVWSGGSNNGNWQGGVTLTAVSRSGKSYARVSRAKESIKLLKRKEHIARATPGWTNQAAMLGIYEECQRMSASTGVVYHVDHIVPLTSKYVCGLHCEANLRVIPGIDNIRKHNRTWPDKP